MAQSEGAKFESDLEIHRTQSFWPDRIPRVYPAKLRLYVHGEPRDLKLTLGSFDKSTADKLATCPVRQSLEEDDDEYRSFSMTLHFIRPVYPAAQ